MFYPTKLGSDEFHDVSLFIRKLAYSVYNRDQSNERRDAGMAPWRFRINPVNLDRFIKRDDDQFSIDGPNQGSPVICGTNTGYHSK